MKNLNLEDWQQYKTGSSSAHLEKTLSGNDMNYLAAQGFEKANINAGDIADVMKRIDKKTLGASQLNAIFIGGIVAIVFSGLFLLFIRENKNSKLIEENSPLLQTTSRNEHAVISIKDSQLLAENLKEAENKKHGPWHKEHFAIKNIEQPYEPKPIEKP